MDLNIEKNGLEKFPDLLLSRDDKLNFKKNSVRSISKVVYTSGDCNLGNSHFINLNYNLNSKILRIEDINSGFNSGRVFDITRKTIETMIDNFEVLGIGFMNIEEPRTCDILETLCADTFNMSELDNFENSPFLKNLNYFGFELGFSNAYLNNKQKTGFWKNVSFSDQGNYLLGVRNLK